MKKIIDWLRFKFHNHKWKLIYSSTSTVFRDRHIEQNFKGIQQCIICGKIRKQSFKL